MVSVVPTDDRFRQMQLGQHLRPIDRTPCVWCHYAVSRSSPHMWSKKASRSSRSSR